MAAPTITNPVPVDELGPWLTALHTALLGDPSAETFPERVRQAAGRWDAERIWGVRESGTWVATLATEARTVTVPAGAHGTVTVAADALTGVSVAATHRRQGLLRRMLGLSLAAARDRGDLVSVLVAAEWPIYGRFGYAPAVFGADFTLRPRRPRPLLPPPTPGSLRTVDQATLFPIAAGVFDAARGLRPGQLDRDGTWWARRLGQEGNTAIFPRPTYVVHDGPDGPDGMVGWRATRDFGFSGPLGAIEVSDLVAANEQAYVDLWSYLCSIDVVDDIALTVRPVDEPIRWLLDDGRALAQTHTGDLLWLRLLDVPGALAARGYAVDGSVVLDVRDDDPGGYGAGRVCLEVSDGAVACRPTGAAADIRLDQRTLAAIYLGGHRLRALAGVGRVEEARLGTIDRLDAMFAVGDAPLNQTFF